MADLRGFLEGLGFADVRTILQSGNAVFSGGGAAGANLERRLESEARAQLDLDTVFFVRSSEQWADVVSSNPFCREAADAPGKLVVVFLKKVASARGVADLESRVRGPERVRAAGRRLYVVYPDGIGRSRLTAAVIEKALGSRATARNWNTVRKLESASNPGA